MRPARHTPTAQAGACALACATLIGAPWPAHAEPPAIVDSTRVDHDAIPVRTPPHWEQGYWGLRVQRSIADPLAHVFDVPDKLIAGAHALGARTRREAVNVNAFDEVPNSSWFTNRNHVRAVPVAELQNGPDAMFLPTKPWTITHMKTTGSTPGFQIRDKDGRKWLVKLDPRGHAQLSSGSDMVARTLYHAAGYNVPHNECVRFRRGDLLVDPAFARGDQGGRFSEAFLDSCLAWGAMYPDGEYAALASLYLPGDVLGAPSLTRRRPGDANDWYAHVNRRELRGFYVVSSWLGNWDTEDHQFLDTFVATRDSLGHVAHYVLDVGSTFGAMADGPKFRWAGYEYGFDPAWVTRRIVTLGFATEPWRRAHQDTGIPSVGRFESAVYEPQKFKAMSQQPAFRAMTDRDAYWGAKIVASFSDAQIAAAVDAGRYEDPRARDFLVRNIILRRDKVTRYWFDRVAPLDFFTLRDGALRFHDLAIDVALAGVRSYAVDAVAIGGGAPRATHLHVDQPVLPLATLEEGATHLTLALSIVGSRALPTHIELTREGSTWIVTRVSHA